MTAADSYALPNYIGELFEKSRKPNALLRLVGGLTGNIKVIGHTEFSMGVDYSLDSAAQPNILEGATPAASQVSNTQSSNVVQIFQEAVEFYYSRLGNTQQIEGVTVIPGGSVGPLINTGTPEAQTALKIQQIARDMNYTFLRGAYVKPANNSSTRKTRGVRTAVTTNLFANSGTARPLTTALFDSSMKTMMVNAAFAMGDEVFVLGDATQIGKLAALYSGDTRLPESRDVVGVAVRTIVTQWGLANLVWEPDLAAGELLIFQPAVCRVVMMEIPGKGLLFQEELSRVGSSDKRQIYSEAGLDYKHEVFHGVIDDLDLT